MFGGLQLDGVEQPSALLHGTPEGEHHGYVCHDVGSSAFGESQFASREGVKAFARYHIYLADEPVTDLPDAVVFFNYDNADEIDADRIDRMQRAVAAVTGLWGQPQAHSHDIDILLEQAESIARILRGTREAMVHDEYQAVIASVLECAARATGCVDEAFCGIDLYDAREDVFRTSSIWRGGAVTHWEDGSGPTWPGGVLRVAMSFKRPLFIEDVHAIRRPGALNDKYNYMPPSEIDNAGPEMVQEIAAPIYLDGSAVGVLNIEVPRVCLRPNHVKLVEALADVAAIAIGSNKRDHARARMLSLVGDVVSAQSARQRVAIIEKSIVEELDAHACQFWYYRPDESGRAKFEWATGQPGELNVRTTAGGSGPGFSEWLLNSGVEKTECDLRGVVLSDFTDEGGFSCKALVAAQREDGWGALSVVGEHPLLSGRPERLNPARDPKTRAEVALALVIHGQRLGVVWVKRETSRPFNDDELALLSLFGVQASLALYVTRHQELAVQDQVWRETTEATFGADRAPGITRASVRPRALDSVVVLNADIRRSTGVLDCLSGTAQSQRAFVDMMQDLYRAAQERMLEHDGVLATFMGDGVMGLFGVYEPVQSDPAYDPVVRAVTAALSLVDWFREVEDRWGEVIATHSGGQRPPFGLGASVCLGPAMVGNLRSDMRPVGFDYTAVGKAPTLAARVQELASATELEGRNLWPDADNHPGNAILLCPLDVQRRFLRRAPDGATPEFTKLRDTVSFGDLGRYFELYDVRRAATEEDEGSPDLDLPDAEVGV